MISRCSRRWAGGGGAQTAIAEEVLGGLVTFHFGVKMRNNEYSSSSLRFGMYHWYLAAVDCDVGCHNFPMVMTSDVFDVVFVRDPFSASRRAVVEALDEQRAQKKWILEVVEAASSVLLPDGSLSGQTNYFWVQKCFGGQPMVEEVRGQNVSCSGTTVGETYSMMEYVREMDQIMRANSKTCGAPAIDQAVHNVLLNSKSRRVDQKIEIVKAGLGQGPVATFDCANYHVTAARSKVLLVPGTKKPYAVLHQVNRCKDFLKRHDVLDVRTCTLRAATPEDGSLCEQVSDPPESWWTTAEAEEEALAGSSQCVVPTGSTGYDRCER